MILMLCPYLYLHILQLICFNIDFAPAVAADGAALIYLMMNIYSFYAIIFYTNRVSLPYNKANLTPAC